MNLKYRSFRPGIIRDLVPPVDRIRAEGLFRAILRERPGGRIIGETEGPNLLVNQGLQFLLDTTLRGATYSVAPGPYMGVILNATAAAATDTMVTIGARESHGYAARLGSAFSATTTTGTAGNANASAAVTSPPQFTCNIAGPETITGAFITLGTGVSTVPVTGTTGTLFSEGLFGTSQSWSNGNQLTVSYSVTLSSP
jgi:hypothetical protein